LGRLVLVPLRAASVAAGWVAEPLVRAVLGAAQPLLRFIPSHKHLLYATRWTPSLHPLLPANWLHWPHWFGGKAGAISARIKEMSSLRSDSPLHTSTRASSTDSTRSTHLTPGEAAMLPALPPGQWAQWSQEAYCFFAAGGGNEPKDNRGRASGGRRGGGDGGDGGDSGNDGAGAEGRGGEWWAELSAGSLLLMGCLGVLSRRLLRARYVNTHLGLTHL